MSEDTPKRPLFLISKSRQDALEHEYMNRAGMMKAMHGHGKSDVLLSALLAAREKAIPVASERGPIVPIYPDYESDLPFVDNSRAVPTSNGEDVPTTRHLLPITPKPAVNLGELEFDDVTEGMVRKAAARLVKMWMEQAGHEGIVAIPLKELTVGGVFSMVKMAQCPHLSAKFPLMCGILSVERVSMDGCRIQIR